MDEYRNKRVLVIDIGGLNVNYAIFDRLVPQIDSLFSNNRGSNLLRSRIREALSSRFGTAISIDDSEQTTITWLN
jgi:plasmid segregation protein ParM